MSQEINLVAALTMFKPSIMTTALARAITGKQYTMTGNLFTFGEVNVLTTNTTFPLGAVTQPHWAWFYNSDPTNYFTIQNGGSGNVFLRLYPGEGSAIPLDIACNPVGIANTAPCLAEYFILSL